MIRLRLAKHLHGIGQRDHSASQPQRSDVAASGKAEQQHKPYEGDTDHNTDHQLQEKALQHRNGVGCRGKRTLQRQIRSAKARFRYNQDKIEHCKHHRKQRATHRSHAKLARHGHPPSVASGANLGDHARLFRHYEQRAENQQRRQIEDHKASSAHYVVPAVYGLHGQFRARRQKLGIGQRHAHLIPHNKVGFLPS